MASLSPSPQLSITLPNGIYKPIPDKVLSHLQMASISPSSYPPSLQMASISPFPTSHCWDSTMRVQISGHSSVQSSSTFGSRKARKPIYILRFKKIEQGQLLYPKICPPIFLKNISRKIHKSNLARHIQVFFRQDISDNVFSNSGSAQESIL